MFSYYGSKSKIVDYYPTPKFNKIIEPFAGSARYALRFFENDILLVDKYPVIVDVWNYLKNASEKDILGLPRLKNGQSLNEFNLSYEENMFLGFSIKQGSERPSNKAVKFATNLNPGEKNTNIERNLKRVASQLYKIRHWSIMCEDYLNIPDENATWFVDPPYQFGGKCYVMSNKYLNYKELSNWCKNRKGQVIVCENTKADWMDFKPFVKRCDNSANAHKNKTREAIWSNYETNFDYKQCSLF